MCAYRLNEAIERFVRRTGSFPTTSEVEECVWQTLATEPDVGFGQVEVLGGFNGYGYEVRLNGWRVEDLLPRPKWKAPEWLTPSMQPRFDRTVAGMSRSHSRSFLRRHVAPRRSHSTTHRRSVRGRGCSGRPRARSRRAACTSSSGSGGGGSSGSTSGSGDPPPLGHVGGLEARQAVLSWRLWRWCPTLRRLFRPVSSLAVERAIATTSVTA